MDNDTSNPSFFDKISDALQRDPKNTEGLISILEHCNERAILDDEALDMIKGVLQVSDMKVRDIMIARAQMVTIDYDQPFEDVLKTIVDSHHSRFPVMGDNRDEVVGILLAKDLLKHATDHNTFNLKGLLHPATLVPESKRADNLLKDFQRKHNHMVIVVDEYGGVSGLVTIEDVLEEIVGEIEDEHFVDDQQDFIHQQDNNRYFIKALTPIELFNRTFDSQLNDKYFDTIGGLVAQQFGHLPTANETIDIDGFLFKVVHADKRRIQLLEVRPPAGVVAKFNQADD